MTASTHDPYQLQRLLSRRSFLSISSLGAAAALGLSLDPAGASARPARPARDAVKARTADSGYHKPFSLESSSVLSEDHFLVKTGKIDPAKDRVVAYSRADGLVEAVLLEGETISQIYRDPSAPGGWDSRAIASGATDMVAGMADNKQGYPTLHVFYRTASGDVRHLIEDLPAKDGISSARFSPVDDVSWGPEVPGALQITSDLYRNLLVFCISSASAQNAADSKLGFHWTAWGLPGGQAQSGILTGFGLYAPDGSLTSGSAAISYSLSAFQGHPALLLYLPSATGVQICQFMPDYATEQLAVSAKVAPFAEQPPSFASLLGERVEVESVDYLFSPGVNYLPTAIVRGVDQELYALTVDFLHQAWKLQQLQLPSDKREPGRWDWEPSNLNLGEDNVLETNALLNLFVVSAETLSVVRQVDLGGAAKNAVAPVYNPALPLQGRVAAVSSQARASPGDELIVVGSGGDLEVLNKGTDGGWTAAVIHLRASEPAEVSTYRVQLTLSDTWGVRVANTALQVTTSAPAIALLNDQATTLSSAPVTVTTDRSGQVTIPIVAYGLWAPKLTVSGGGLTGPVTVAPSESVNEYMTGTATLNLLPQLSGDILAGAATPGGAAVFPSAKQDRDVAAQAATVLAGAAAAGTDPTVGGQSTEQRFHDTAIAHRRTVKVGDRAAHRARTVTVDGVELSFGGLLDDALYAIRRGAAKVGQVALTWDKTLNRWVSTITADFDAWAHQAIDVAIGGLEDAAHIFHGVINHLGALVEDVLDWLKAHVLELLADTVTLAARYDGWLLQFADELHTLTQKAKQGADGYLAGQGPRVKQVLADIKRELGSKSISSFADPETFSTKLRASTESTPQPLTKASDNWLLDKVTQSGLGLSKAPQLGDALDTLVKDVKHDSDASGQEFVKAANDFRDTLSQLVSNPKNFGAVGIDKLIDAIGAVVDAALAAARGVVDVVFDLLAAAIAAFKELLGTPLNELGLLGPLLKAAGMENGPTVGGLVTLLIAFPTALGYKLAHFDAGALPFKHAKTSSVLRTADATDDGLSYATFAATSFWALMDTLAASTIAVGDEPPALFAWIDIVAPAVIGVLTVPAHDDGVPFSSAIKLDDDGDVYTAVSWVLAGLPGVFAGVSYYVGERYSAADAEVASQSALYLTSMSGFLGAVFGVIAAVDTSSGLADAARPAALAVLGNTAAALAWGLEQGVVESTDGVSALLAGVIGGVCTFVGAAMDSFGV